jgi:Ser/Thr protein kinase RdoA (MazF antagonist)
MRAFEDLTNTGQARRLRATAFAALDPFAIRVRRLRLITNEFNAVFRVDSEDDERFMLRVNIPRRRTLNEVRAEVAWLRALASETDVGVPTPMPTPDGEFVVTVAADGVPELRHCVAFRWIDGVKLANRLSESTVAALGELTAKLHEQAADWTPPPGLRTWDTPFPLDDHPSHLVGVEPGDRPTFDRALEMIEAVLERSGDRPTRMIHGDLHQDNVLVSGRKLVAIDFDDALLGHPVQDIGVTFWNLREEPRYDVLRDAYRRGYERVSPWPETEPGDIEAFVADRSMMLIDYSLREADPEEIASRPGFIQREVAHLRRWIEQGGG